MNKLTAQRVYLFLSENFDAYGCNPGSPPKKIVFGPGTEVLQPYGGALTAMGFSKIRITDTRLRIIGDLNTAIFHLNGLAEYIHKTDSKGFSLYGFRYVDVTSSRKREIKMEAFTALEIDSLEMQPEYSCRDWIDMRPLQYEKIPELS